MSGYRMVRFEDLRACVCCLAQRRTGLSRFGYLVGRAGLVVPLCWTCGPLAENGGIRGVVCGVCLDGGVVQAAPLRLECRCRPGSVRVTPVCPGHAERAVDPVRWRHTLVPNAGIAPSGAGVGSVGAFYG